MKQNELYEPPKSGLTEKEEIDPWRDNESVEVTSDLDSSRQRGLLRASFDFVVGLIAVVIGLALALSQVLSIGKNVSDLMRHLPSGTQFEVGFYAGGLVWMVPVIMAGWYLIERGFNTILGKGWYKIYKTGPSYFFDIRYPIYGTLIAIVVVTTAKVVSKFA